MEGITRRLSTANDNDSVNSSTDNFRVQRGAGNFWNRKWSTFVRKISGFSSYVRAACSRRRTTSEACDSTNNCTLNMAEATVAENPWPITKDDYELLEAIGVGATAVVYKAFCKSRSEKCAIKRINLEKFTSPLNDRLQEIQSMSSCSHENIATYYTSFVVDHELWLVLELLEGGSLLDVIKHKMRVSDCYHGVFDEATIATVLYEILKGLEYLHATGQVHRDLKSANVLLGKDGSVQIADFGVSAWVATGSDLSRQKYRYTFVGTPCWMAPEVMEQVHGYDVKADIWSLGITAIELATGKAPYYKHPPMKVLMLTMQNDPPNLDTGGHLNQFSGYGRSFRKFICDCLQKDPMKRASASELLQHPFLKKAKDAKYLIKTLFVMGPTMEARANETRLNSWESTSCLEAGPSSMCNYLQRSVTGEWDWGEEGIEPDGNEQQAQRKPLDVLHTGGNTSVSEIETEEPPVIEEEQPAEASQSKMFRMVLRKWNDRRELTDIEFDFVLGRDTVENVASELVGANLVDPRDEVAVSVNLEKILEPQQPPLKVIKFHLNSTGPNEAYDEGNLVGFAQISIKD